MAGFCRPASSGQGQVASKAGPWGAGRDVGRRLRCRAGRRRLAVEQGSERSWSVGEPRGPVGAAEGTIRFRGRGRPAGAAEGTVGRRPAVGASGGLGQMAVWRSVPGGGGGGLPPRPGATRHLHPRSPPPEPTHPCQRLNEPSPSWGLGAREPTRSGDFGERGRCAPQCRIGRGRGRAAGGVRGPSVFHVEHLGASDPDRERAPSGVPRGTRARHYALGRPPVTTRWGARPSLRAGAPARHQALGPPSRHHALDRPPVTTRWAARPSPRAGAPARHHALGPPARHHALGPPARHYALGPPARHHALGRPPVTTRWAARPSPRAGAPAVTTRWGTARHHALGRPPVTRPWGRHPVTTRWAARPSPRAGAHRPSPRAGPPARHHALGRPPVTTRWGARPSPRAGPPARHHALGRQPIAARPGASCSPLLAGFPRTVLALGRAVGRRRPSPAALALHTGRPPAGLPPSRRPVRRNRARDPRDSRGRGPRMPASSGGDAWLLRAPRTVRGPTV